MRKFSTEFSEHIASGATTLCTCWLILRTDGVDLGFTDHDEKIEFDGIEFLPANGLDGHEVAAKLGPQVDTSEVKGILHSSAISELDINLGRYRGATVKTYSVNWRNIAMRELLRIDSIGEIVREDGIFRAELRSAQQALNIPKGRRYQSLCDVVVGSENCGIDIEVAQYRGVGTVSAIIDRFSIAVTGLSEFQSGWFDHGKTVWTTGVRQKLNDRLHTHILANGSVNLTFAEPVGDWVMVGDQFFAHVGCDRRFSSCKDKFANGINFQGFPHIPGNDFVLSYPKPGDNFSGTALIN